MNAHNRALEAGLRVLLLTAGTTAVLSDGGTVAGILQAVDDEEMLLEMQGGLNARAPKMWSFQSVRPIPVGFGVVTIEGQTYNVSKCQGGQGCYVSYLTLKEI